MSREVPPQWRVRATCVIDRLQTGNIYCPTTVARLPLVTLNVHTDDTEYSDQAGLCFSKQPPLRGHLSAVAVVKFNESERDGGSSVCAAAGQRSVGCSSVQVLMLSGLLLLVAIRSRRFIISGTLCLNRYSSANKRYFYVKF